MKVKFNDCEFGSFEPHFEIEYGGAKYRAIEVEYEMDDGRRYSAILAECELQNMMCQKTGVSDCDFTGEEARIDSSIAFYPDNNDGVYSCLETITGEEMK